MTKINIILGSSRENALGRNLFLYLKSNKSLYEQLNATTFDFLEIKDFQLPFFYEKLPPMNNKNRQLPANQQAWVDDMATADGYIFLTPEYNHSFPAVLKNAIDYLSFQVANKPAIVMSYSDNSRGGQFGGADLIPVLNRLNALVLPPVIAIGNVQKNFSETGTFLQNAPSKDFYQHELEEVVRKIAFYSNLLKQNQFLPNK